MYPGIGSADLRGPLPEALLARGESLTGDVSVRSRSHTVRVVAGPTRGHCTPTITPRHLSRTESMVIKCFIDTQLLSQAEVHSELMDIALKVKQNILVRLEPTLELEGQALC